MAGNFTTLTLVNLNILVNISFFRTCWATETSAQRHLRILQHNINSITGRCFSSKEGVLGVKIKPTCKHSNTRAFGSFYVSLCLASPANFIYGRVLAKVLSHVTIMPGLLRPVNNFLGQVIGNASEGKCNTVNSSSSGEVTFKKCLNSGITLFSSINSNKSQTFATGPYQRLHEARPRRVVWLWEPK